MSHAAKSAKHSSSAPSDHGTAPMVSPTPSGSEISNDTKDKDPATQDSKTNNRTKPVTDHLSDENSNIASIQKDTSRQERRNSTNSSTRRWSLSNRFPVLRRNSMPASLPGGTFLEELSNDRRVSSVANTAPKFANGSPNQQQEKRHGSRRLSWDGNFRLSSINFPFSRRNSTPAEMTTQAPYATAPKTDDITKIPAAASRSETSTKRAVSAEIELTKVLQMAPTTLPPSQLRSRSENIPQPGAYQVQGRAIVGIRHLAQNNRNAISTREDLTDTSCRPITDNDYLIEASPVMEDSSNIVNAMNVSNEEKLYQQRRRYFTILTALILVVVLVATIVGVVVGVNQTDGIALTLAPTQETQSFDEEAYKLLEDYPYQLHKLIYRGTSNTADTEDYTTEEHGQFPLLTILDDRATLWEQGTYNVSSSIFEGNAILSVEETILKWRRDLNDGKYQNEVYASTQVKGFIRDIQFKAIGIRGNIRGDTNYAITSSFAGLLANFHNTTTNETISRVIPFQAYSENEIDNDDSVCERSFIEEAFQDTLSNCSSDDGSGDGSIFLAHTERRCIQKILNRKQNSEETLLQAQTTAFGYAYCLQQFSVAALGDMGGCMTSIHNDAIVARLLGEQEGQITEDSNECNYWINTVESKCMSCEKCSSDTPHVQCCSDNECVKYGNAICAGHTCVQKAALRFTLTWAGNDDYDLHVISPKTGNDISSDKKKDNKSGGQWESHHKNDQGSDKIFQYYTEQVWFPENCKSNETYYYYVNQHVRAGIKDEEWDLAVYVNNELFENHNGTGSSSRQLSFVCQ